MAECAEVGGPTLGARLTELVNATVDLYEGVSVCLCMFMCVYVCLVCVYVP